MRLVVLLVLLSTPTPLFAGGTVTGRVVVTDAAKKNRLARDQKDVWVYLRLDPETRFKPDPVSTVIAQQKLRFIPRVRVIPAASTVAFPNQDRSEKHNVFSNGLPKSAIGRFDLRVFQGGQSKTRKFDLAGEYVIYCDIHMDMVAYVKVVNSNWIAPVQNSTFKIENVPAGKYQVVAWRPNSYEERSAAFQVVDGETVIMPGVINIAWKPDPPHKRKDDGDYKGRWVR